MIQFLPDRYNTYFEPFLGAGALFFLLEPRHARLSDMCGPLIDTYLTIATDTEAVYEQLAQMDVLDQDQYYRIRSERPSSLVRVAARFLYLNRAGWNGLYRVNNKGDYNVPYGRPRSANIVDLDHLRKCAETLGSESVSISAVDFGHLDDSAVAGDLVYFDPPYVTGHHNKGFVDYNEKLFSWSDQQRLADLARRLQKRGVTVIISNALHENIIGLYPTFQVVEIVRRSALASEVSSRKSVTEAMFY